MFTTQLRKALAVLVITSTFALGCGDDPTSPSAPTVASIEVTPGSRTLDALGATAAFTAVALDEDGEEIEGIEFLWLSSDHGVATVSAGGVVTATGDGSTSITAAAAGEAGSGTVTVARSVSSVVVSPADSIFALDASIELAAAALDAGGSPIPAASLTWTSSDEAVATVDDDGRVTSVANGSATITAAAGGHSASTVVVVAQKAWSGRSSVILSRSSVPADDVTTVEVELRLNDRNGYPLANRDAVLTLSGTGNTIVQPDPTDASGRTVGSLQSNTGEFKTLTIHVPSLAGGPGVTLTQSPVVWFTASELVFTVQPTATTALRPDLAPTITLMDAAGNVVTSDTTAVALTGTTGAGLWGQTTVTPTAGVAVFEALSVDLTGTMRLHAIKGEVEALSDEFAVASMYTALPTMLTTVSACDDCSQSVALTTPFALYGVSFGTLFVVSNGFVATTATSSLSNTALPNSNAPNNLVALFWDDLAPNSAGDVYYSTDATSTAIEYRGVQFYAVAGSAVTVQMRLFTGADATLGMLPGDIAFVYHSLSNTGDPNRALGSSATVGVENVDGTVGTQVSFNSTAVVRNGRHVLLRYNGTGYDRIR